MVYFSSVHTASPSLEDYKQAYIVVLYTPVFLQGKVCHEWQNFMLLYTHEKPAPMAPKTGSTGPR